MENQAKKLRLEDIKVNSFVTSSESILGGDSASTTHWTAAVTFCGNATCANCATQPFPCRDTKILCLQEEG